MSGNTPQRPMFKILASDAWYKRHAEMEEGVDISAGCAERFEEFIQQQREKLDHGSTGNEGTIRSVVAVEEGNHVHEVRETPGGSEVKDPEGIRGA